MENFGKEKKMKEEKIQCSIISAFEKENSLPLTMKRIGEIDRLIIGMIVCDLQPLSFVTDHGFRMLVANWEPKYVIKSRQYYSDLLNTVYLEEMTKLKDILATQASISLTTDGWTSVSTESYITYTAHYISQDFFLHSHVLATKFTPQSHTGDNLFAELDSLCNIWNVQGKISSIVTDNAANIVNAITKSKIPNQRCFAHTLELSVNAALKHIDSLLEKLKRRSSYFKRSALATQALLKYQIELHINQHKLKQSCITRWYSTYEMIQRALEQEKPVYLVFMDNDEKDLSLTPEEIDLLKQVESFLKPFAAATQIMCTENGVSSSCILPLIFALKNTQCKIQDRDHPCLKNMKTTIALEMQNRWPGTGTKSVAMLATILDPRYKELRYLSQSAREEAYFYFKQQLSKEVIETEEVVDEGHLMKKQKISLTEYQKLMDTILPKSFSEDPLSDEFNSYISERVRDCNINPLVWWRSNKDRFPYLSVLARKYLAIPATSAPSERIFSKAGELVSKRRANLQHSLIDRILFLNVNNKNN